MLQARAGETPDHRTCDDALTRVGTEPAGTGRPVDLGPSKRRLVAAVVPGIGWDCIAQWLQPPGSVAAHVRKHGFDQVAIKVDALSGTATNARQIRDAVMAMDLGPGAPRLVLVGYSKGAPDVLDAIVTYPEIRSRVAAVMSVAGSVGGSPLANDAEQFQADLLRHFPDRLANPATAVRWPACAPPCARPGWRRTRCRRRAYYSVVDLPAARTHLVDPAGQLREAGDASTGATTAR